MSIRRTGCSTYVHTTGRHEHRTGRSVFALLTRNAELGTMIQHPPPPTKEDTQPTLRPVARGRTAVLWLSVRLYLCLSVCRSLVCLSGSLSTCLTMSVCLPVCVSVCLPVRVCAGVWVRVLVVRAPVSNAQGSGERQGGGGEGGQTGEQRGWTDRRMSWAGASCKRPQGGYAVVGSAGFACSP